MSAGRIADRWPPGVADEWVAVPVALLRHAAALGLDNLDLRFLVALECFQRDDGEGYPAVTTLAALCGCSVSTVKRRKDKLRRAGLIEVRRERRANGSWGRNRYTRRGLARRLAELQEAERQGSPMMSPGPGTTEVSPGQGPLSVSPGPELTQVSPEVEAVGAEAEEAEGARRRAPRKRSRNGRRGWGKAEQVEATTQALDAIARGEA